MRKPNRGYLTIEYVFLIGIVIAALIGMSVYLKRSLGGKWREAANSFGFGRQYDKLHSRRTDLRWPHLDFGSGWWHTHLHWLTDDIYSVETRLSDPMPVGAVAYPRTGPSLSEDSD